MAIINIIKQDETANSNYFSEDISNQISFENLLYVSSSVFKANSLEVYLNGILLKPEQDYVEGGDLKSFSINIPTGTFNKYFHPTSTLIIKYLIA
jgi:hypothetical protein